MRKIHVTRQFFEASGRHGDLIEKTKNPFLDKVNRSMCAKFLVCIFFRSARRRDTNKQINTQILFGKHILFRTRDSIIFVPNKYFFISRDLQSRVGHKRLELEKKILFDKL